MLTRDEFLIRIKFICKQTFDNTYYKNFICPNNIDLSIHTFRNDSEYINITLFKNGVYITYLNTTEKTLEYIIKQNEFKRI